MGEPLDGAAGIYRTANDPTLAAYASPQRRVIAYMLDQFLAFVAINFAAGLALRALMVLGIWGAHWRGADMAGVEVGVDLVSMWGAMGFAPKLAVLLAFLVANGPLYFVLMESSPWQATLCKRLLRVYITDDERRRIGAGSAAWRWIVKACFSGILAILQLVVVEVSQRRKAIHDFAAKTVVLAGRPEDKLESWRLPVAFGVSAAWVMATFMALF